MSSPKLGAAMAALTTAFQGAAALTGVTVTEGDSVTAAAQLEFIIVGHDGTLEADGSLAEFTTAGQSTSAFIAEGTPPLQQEDGVVNVVAVSQSGDSGDLPAQVTEAERLLSACDDTLTDLRSGTIVFDSVSGARYITRQSPQGCAAIIAFAVSYSSPW